MYIYKGREKKLGGSEEEEELKNMGNLFPDFSNDFQDFVESHSFEDSGPAGTNVSSTLESPSFNEVDILETDDVDFFIRVHSITLSNVWNHYLKPGKVDKQHDFLTPFVSS